MMRKGPIGNALEKAKRSLPLEDADSPTLELARALAKAVDSGRLQLSRELLASLVALGMAPNARKAVVNAAKPQTSALDELRARRERKA